MALEVFCGLIFDATGIALGDFRGRAWPKSLGKRPEQKPATLLTDAPSPNTRRGCTHGARGGFMGPAV